MDKAVLGQVTTLAGLTVAMTGWDGGDNRFIYYVELNNLKAYQDVMMNYVARCYDELNNELNNE
jgi:hypothetical protein